jgi:hypothetical protein
MAPGQKKVTIGTIFDKVKKAQKSLEITDLDLDLSEEEEEEE